MRIFNWSLLLDSQNVSGTSALHTNRNCIQPLFSDQIFMHFYQSKCQILHSDASNAIFACEWAFSRMPQAYQRTNEYLGMLDNNWRLSQKRGGHATPLGTVAVAVVCRHCTTPIPQVLRLVLQLLIINSDWNLYFNTADIYQEICTNGFFWQVNF